MDYVLIYRTTKIPSNFTIKLSYQNKYQIKKRPQTRRNILILTENSGAKLTNNCVLVNFFELNAEHQKDGP